MEQELGSRASSELVADCLARASRVPEAERSKIFADYAADVVAEVMSILAPTPSTLGAVMAEASELAQDENADDHWKGRRIGPYCIESVLGHGAFGRVFEVSHVDEPQLRAALKVLVRDHDPRQDRARFAAEHRILASLDHPNVVRLLNVGSSEGQLYLVTELVRGRPLGEYADHKQLAIRERLDLFVQACRGVEAAHEKHIWHRDLKPANILVTDASGSPTTKILDFGVAKILDASPVPARGGLTVSGSMVGTLDYMSPEQLRGVPDADTDWLQSDVYSLGVVLYELITGQRPVLLPARLPLEACIQPLLHDKQRRPEDVVLPPSSMSPEEGALASARLARARSTSVEDLVKELRGDLGAVMLKAIERDPRDRYARVAELRADVENYLGERPVEALHAPWHKRALKWVKRNPLRAAAAVGAVALVTVAGISGLVALGQMQVARAVTRIVERQLDGLDSVRVALEDVGGRRGREAQSMLLRQGLEWMQEIEQAASTLGVANVARIARARSSLATLAASIGDRARALAQVEAGIKAARDSGARELTPILASLFLTRADIHSAEGQRDLAAADYAEAMAAARSAVAAVHDLSAELVLLAVLEHAANHHRLFDGEATAARLIEEWTERALSDPVAASAHRDARLARSSALYSRKKVGEALEIQTALHAEFPHNQAIGLAYARSLRARADARQQANDLEAAWPDLEEATRVCRALVADDPDLREAQSHLAHTLYWSGEVRRAQGKLGLAEADLQECLDLRRALHEQDPGDVKLHNAWIVAVQAMMTLAHQKQDFDSAYGFAEAAARELGVLAARPQPAVALVEAAAGASKMAGWLAASAQRPDDVRRHRDDATDRLERLAGLVSEPDQRARVAAELADLELEILKDRAENAAPNEARPLWLQVRDRRQALLEESLRKGTADQTSAFHMFELGEICHQYLGDLDGAAQWFGRGRTILKDLVVRGDNATLEPALLSFDLALCRVYRARGSLAEHMDIAREAVAMGSKHPPAEANRREEIKQLEHDVETFDGGGTTKK